VLKATPRAELPLLRLRTMCRARANHVARRRAVRHGDRVYSLYDAFALTRTLAAPMNAWADAVRGFWSHPGLPLSHTPLGRAMAATGELVERATRRYPKPPFGLTTTVCDGQPVVVRETLVRHTPFCDLIHFERATPRADPRVLLVAPLSGHHASLLRDTVAALLPEHDVYVTDWIDARLVPVSAGRFDLDDYIDLLRELIRTLGRPLGGKLHVVAVCQPAVPALAAVALLAEDGDAAVPQSLTVMGGPVDTRISPTSPGEFALSRSLAWFEANLVHGVPAGEPGVRRRVYPGFVQLSAFLSMNVERHARAQVELFRDLARGDEDGAQGHRRFYDDYLAVMDLPAEYYLQTIASVFQHHELPRGELRYRGERRVRPAAIRTTALMTIEGENDDITGLGQTFAAHALCPNIPDERRVHYVQPQAGHYGIFSGRRWRDEIAPRLRDFIRHHD
jgi:poly(3-hydroxybutyrate) depolymerase